MTNRLEQLLFSSSIVLLVEGSHYQSPGLAVTLDNSKNRPMLFQLIAMPESQFIVCQGSSKWIAGIGPHGHLTSSGYDA